LVAPRRGEDDPARILGYRALNVVQLRVRDLGALGRVLDAAVAVGANVLRGVTFAVLDRDRLEAEARARAVSDAFERAQQLAAAAGVRLGDLLSLAEGAPAFPAAERFERAALAAAPGPIETGTLEVVVAVEARYRIAR
ncbi:MAG TPA: SIMPL domain-containing protein, partial [Candidatus Binatia bacterium]|nr:SIMPL domain-containing protein [Candidatus Binatia bacterium]